MTGDGLQDIVLLRNGNVAYWPNLGHGRFGLPGADAPRAAAARRATTRAGCCSATSTATASPTSSTSTTAGCCCGATSPATRGRRSRSSSPARRTWSTPTPCSWPTCTAPAWPGCCAAGRRRLRPAAAAVPRPHRRAQAVPARPRWTTTSARAPPCSTVPSTAVLPAPTRPTRRPGGGPRCRSRCTSSPASRCTTQISGGRLITEYRYHHGYWDGVEREFRGFAHGRAARHRDVPRPTPSRHHYSPPTLTKTWFHLGPVAARRGRRLDRAGPDATSTGPATPPMLAAARRR